MSEICPKISTRNSILYITSEPIILLTNATVTHNAFILLSRCRCNRSECQQTRIAVVDGQLFKSVSISIMVAQVRRNTLNRECKEMARESFRHLQSVRPPRVASMRLRSLTVSYLVIASYWSVVYGFRLCTNNDSKHAMTNKEN